MEKSQKETKKEILDLFDQLSIPEQLIVMLFMFYRVQRARFLNWLGQWIRLQRARRYEKNEKDHAGVGNSVP